MMQLLKNRGGMKYTQHARNRGELPQTDKGQFMKNQLTASILLNHETLNTSPRWEGDKDVPSCLSVKHCARGFSHSNYSRKRNNRHPDWKGRS